MYRIKEIQDALLHVVGWEQNINPEKEIDSSLTETESGLFFQGTHPLMTLNNVEAIMPLDWNIQYKVWENSQSYLKGDKVRNLNVVYIALENNSGSEPTAINPDWKVYNYLSDYLERQTRNGISTAIQTFVQIKQLSEETKNLMERTVLVDSSGRISNTTQNNGRLVGFEITPTRSMGVTTKFEKIGLQMKGGSGGEVKIYLFHSSKLDPIKTVTVNVSNPNGSFQWYKLEDFFLPYISDENNAGGTWFLCYNQDDLPSGMEAVNISKDWSTEPCGGCNAGDIGTWRKVTKYMKISPFATAAPSTFEEFPELFDLNSVIYTNTQNYGINLEMSIGCDLTDFIISQRSMFQTVIQRQVAVILLRTMAMNPDVMVNRNQSNVSKMDLLYELDGNTNGERRAGLGYELEKSYKALSLDTKGLDVNCLKCKNGGVRYRTI